MTTNLIIPDDLKAKQVRWLIKISEIFQPSEYSSFTASKVQKYGINMTWRDVVELDRLGYVTMYDNGYSGAAFRWTEKAQGVADANN